MKIFAIALVGLLLSTFALANSSLESQYQARGRSEARAACQAKIAEKIQALQEFATKHGSSYSGKHEIKKGYEASVPLESCSNDNALVIQLADGQICDVYVAVHNSYHPENPNLAWGTCR